MFKAVPGGEKQLSADRAVGARRHRWSEVEAAEERGDRVAFAEAALGLGGIWVGEHRSTIERARVLSVQRRALSALDQRSGLAGRLRVRIAADEAFASGDDAPLGPELEAARRGSDPLWLADALSLVFQCRLGPQHRQQRRRLAEELVAVAPLTGRDLDAVLGLLFLTVDRLLEGDRRAERFAGELAEALSDGRHDAVRFVAATQQVMATTRAGRLAEAEALAADCVRLGHAVGDVDADAWYSAQLLTIRWLEGRVVELLPLAKSFDLATATPELNNAFAAAAASIAAMAGETETARSILAALRASGLASIAPSSNWLVTMMSVAEVAYNLGDAEAAREVHDLLLPFADLPVLVSLGVAGFGSVHRPLGLAAMALGDEDAAVGHLEAAVVADLALDDGPCRVVATATLAELLERRDAPGDPERARTLWCEAAAGAARFGMSERAEDYEARLRDVAPAAVSCVRRGEVWIVATADREATIRDSVGVAYLARLIERPGTPIAAIELASPNGMVGGEARHELLDGAALAAYRRRVTDLQDDIDDAERCADPERAALARLELDAIIDELRDATGVTGQARTFADASERARTSVRKALTRAVAAIAAVDPELGDEIGRRLVTGTHCVFSDRRPG